jgi:DNA-binding transcriptional regulator YiaG
MDASHEQVRTIRDIRMAVGMSQRAFALRLGISLESYRPWDSGRRGRPDDVMDRALAIAGSDDVDPPMPLSVLSGLLRINECTLRAAARDGRLKVTTQLPAGRSRPILRATHAAGDTFKARYYKHTTRLTQKPSPTVLVSHAPDDFDRQLVALRMRLRITQTQLAVRIGAAGNAVIYQWESRKRRPSSILWRRVIELAESGIQW